MKITVSVSGRFHAFDMSREFESHGVLNSLITSYPRFEAVKYGVPKDKVKSLITHELRSRIWSKYAPDLLSKNIDLTQAFCNSFDRASARQIRSDSDVFIGWASKSLQGLKKAKRLGQLAILDRGSSHCLEARSLLDEESSIAGRQINRTSARINDKELEEYEVCDFILIPSSFVRRSFVKHGVPESKLIQVPYGASLEAFQKKPKKDDVFRVIFAGGMRLRKGVHYLLQAFAELNLPNAELWLVGSKLPEIEKYFGKYEGTYRYFGHVPQAELADYYSQCNLFAICSIEEGLALVQPQAMACGLPLLCTTNTGGEDLIKDGESGFVIPIRSVEAIKEKILWCYENQEACQQMGDAAMKRVQNGLTWNEYGNRLVGEIQQRTSA